MKDIKELTDAVAKVKVAVCGIHLSDYDIDGVTEEILDGLLGHAVYYLNSAQCYCEYKANKEVSNGK